MPTEIEMVPIRDIIPYAMNARTHSEAQVQQIAASIREFGWTNPVLISAENGIIAGHGRVLAAELLGLDDAPCIRLAQLSKIQERALVLADNQLALNSGWDEDLLAAELRALSINEFDLSLIGFDETEIAGLLAQQRGSTDPDAVPEVEEIVISRPGDIWLLGPHRLLCGSSTDPEAVKAAIGSLTVDLVCSDPPYGISVVKGSHIGGAKPFGKVGGGKPHPFAGSPAPRGRVKGVGRAGNLSGGKQKGAVILPGMYAPVIGDDSVETAVAHHALMAQLGVPAIVLWGGNYFADRIPASRCWLVWDKENTGTFADVELAWTNRDAVARLFRHQWSGLIKASERGQTRVHPTQKPVALAEWVIEAVAPDAKVILDGFSGSGWTLIAAERKGIACVAIELSPAYIDVAVRRWEAYTNTAATLEHDGREFTEIEAERSGELASAKTPADREPVSTEE